MVDPLISIETFDEKLTLVVQRWLNWGQYQYECRFADPTSGIKRVKKMWHCQGAPHTITTQKNKN